MCTRAVVGQTTVARLLQSFMGVLKQTGAVCEAAVCPGRLDLLQFAKSYGCPWPDSLYPQNRRGGAC